MSVEALSARAWRLLHHAALRADPPGAPGSADGLTRDAHASAERALDALELAPTPSAVARLSVALVALDQAPAAAALVSHLLTRASPSASQALLDALASDPETLPSLGLPPGDLPFSPLPAIALTPGLEVSAPRAERLEALRRALVSLAEADGLRLVASDPVGALEPPWASVSWFAQRPDRPFVLPLSVSRPDDPERLLEDFAIRDHLYQTWTPDPALRLEPLSAALRRIRATADAVLTRLPPWYADRPSTFRQIVAEDAILSLPALSHREAGPSAPRLAALVEGALTLLRAEHAADGPAQEVPLRPRLDAALAAADALPTDQRPRLAEAAAGLLAELSPALQPRDAQDERRRQALGALAAPAAQGAGLRFAPSPRALTLQPPPLHAAPLDGAIRLRRSLQDTWAISASPAIAPLVEAVARGLLPVEGAP